MENWFTAFVYAPLATDYYFTMFVVVSFVWCEFDG
jgi:hypothetical protein